jgi:NAD(P)-dependent dehydrogenase (short-subunit alcohol dehydrogenase family)
MAELQNRTALVTGGSKGIGRAAGQALAQRGATVALCARDRGRLDTAAQELRDETGSDVRSVAADLATADGVAQAVQEANEQLGRVDILVNVAGAAPPGTVEQLTDEQWDVAIELKLRGYIRLMRAFLPGMKERGFGRIVNIAGNAGKQPDSWLLSSGTVNAAVMALTRAVGNGVAASGVTVNAVCPGPTETTRWAGLQKGYATLFGVSEDEAREQILGGIPAGRIATAEEVAFAVAFFASEQAGHITGESLMVDGGQVRGL